MSIYKSYQFVDKDPIIDYLRTVIADYDKSLKQLSLDSGVNQNTIAKWLYGETKRPQAASLNAVLRSCFYKLSITKLEAPDIIYPTAYQPKANKPPPPRQPEAKSTTEADNAIIRMRVARMSRSAKRKSK
jgi:transcriptional regulator with XRE-family HTH domain